MSGMADWQAKISIDIEDLKKRVKVAEDELDKVTKEDRKIKLDLDTKTLESAIQKLDKMLDSLGKGTGDFKQLESLSKELSAITSEVQSLSKAFGKVDDSGAKTLLFSIQNIDKSLSELSQNILNVNKNMSNMGGNTSGAVRHVENIGNAAADAVKQVDKLADAQSKLDRNTNVLNGLDSNISKYQEIVSLVKEYYELTNKLKQPTLKWQSKPEDYKRIDAYLATAPAVKGSTFTKDEIEKNINSTYHQMAKGINEGKDFAVKAMKSAIQNYWGNITQMPSDNELLSSRKIDRSYKGKSSEEYIIPKKYQDLEKSVLQETIAMNQNNAAYEEEQKQIKANNAVIEERLKLIRQSIKQNGISSDYNGEYKMGLSLKTSDKDKKDIFKMTSDLSQEEMLKEICNMLGVEIPQNAEKAEQAIKEVASITAEKDLKDAFQNNDEITSSSSEKVSNAVKEENSILEQNTQKAKENAEAKQKMANADKEVSNIDLSKYNKKLESYGAKADKYQATANKFKDGGWTSDTYTQQIEKLNKAIGEYKALLASMQNDSDLVTDDNIERLNKFESEIKEVISTVSNMSAAEKGFSFLSAQKELDKINSILNENTAMSREAKAQIRAYYAEIKSGNPSASLDVIHAKIMEIVNAEAEAGRTGKSMWSAIKEKAWYGFAGAIGSYFGLNDIIRYGKQGFNTIRELNTALTEMRKVSDESVQSLKKYQTTTFDTANAVGTTAKQIQNSTADWMRLGESMSEAAESAKDANILLNVSEFEGIDEATESLVSMSQAYKDLDKMDIIDVLNNVGNNYSISTDGLATALKDSASALVTANNDLNEAVALTTAGKFITWIYRNIYQRMNLIAGNASIGQSYLLFIRKSLAPQYRGNHYMTV